MTSASLLPSLNSKTDIELRLAGYISFAIPFISAAVFSIRKATRKYGLRVTPPGPFFAIWGLIYLNFFIASTYALVTDAWLPSSWLLYTAWNVMVGGWTLFFSTATRTGVAVSTVFIIGTLLSMEALWADLVSTGSLDGFMGVYTHNTFALCVGWLCAACNLAVGIVMVYIFGVSYDHQLVAFWLLTPLTYEVFFYKHFTTAHFTSSLGLLFTAAYACTGAAIGSLKPWPRQEQQPAMDEPSKEEERCDE